MCGALHHGGDVVDLVLQRLVESGGIAAGGLDAGRGELLLGLGVLTAAIASAANLSSDRLRNAGLREQPDDGQEVVARDHVGDRRNVRRLEPAARAVVGEKLDLLALDRAGQRRIGREQHLHVPAQQRRHRLPGAAIRNVRHLELERRLQRLHREMMHAADAGRAVVDLARARLHVVDELAQASTPAGQDAPRETAACWPSNATGTMSFAL